MLSGPWSVEHMELLSFLEEIALYGNLLLLSRFYLHSFLVAGLKKTRVFSSTLTIL